MNPLQERANQFEADYEALCLKYGMRLKPVIQSERLNEQVVQERASLIVEVFAPSEIPAKPEEEKQNVKD